MNRKDKDYLAKPWDELLDMDEGLVRYVVPAENCDFVVYHRQGTRQHDTLHVIVSPDN